MAELFDQIDELRRSPGKVAVATLVNTRGTTPRKEGAKMLVGEGGSVLGSVTIGGCVDAQVIEQTEDVLNTNRPRLLELNLGDEEAWEIGLTCGGTIEVFVEPLSADFLERVRAHTDKGGRAAIITRLDGPVGAKILLLDDGTTTGTLGDAALDERFVVPLERSLPKARAHLSRCSRRPRCCSSLAPATSRCRWSISPACSATGRLLSTAGRGSRPVSASRRSTS
jgi:xanthine dehydrogenase accessory factor